MFSLFSCFPSFSHRPSHKIRFFLLSFFFRFNSLISHCFSVRLSLFKTFLYFSFFLSEIFPIVPLCDSSLSCLPFSLSFFFYSPSPFLLFKILSNLFFPRSSFLLLRRSFLKSIHSIFFLNTSAFYSSVLFVFLRSSPSHFSSSHSLSLFSVL